MLVNTTEIARLANVSQSTVSRCLNNSPLVSEATKSRVLKIARDLGFRFNASARSLVTSRSNSIGLVFPRSMYDPTFNYHFRDWQDSIIESVEERDLDVIVAFYRHYDDGSDTITKLIASQKVDGLIVLHPDLDAEVVDYIDRSGVPCVYCKYLPPPCRDRDVNYFSVDQEQGGALAARHLFDLGHRQIACLTTQDPSEEFLLRTKGFCRTLEQAGSPFSPSLLLKGDSSFASGFEAIRRNPGVIKKATALFAQNDLMALGAIDALKSLGVSVPGDLSVVGFDNIELCTFFDPHLTTVEQPVRKIGGLTADWLFQALSPSSGQKKTRTAILPTMVIRDSTAPLRA